jgi:hypothetical protein
VVRQEQEPDRDRRNDGADRDGEDAFGRGSAGLASNPGEEVAGGGDGHHGAGNGAGCVVAKRDPGGQVEQRADGELPLLGDGHDHPAAVPGRSGTHLGSTWWSWPTLERLKRRAGRRRSRCPAPILDV